MALHIEDEEVEALIQEAAEAMGVPPLEAIRILLERRREVYRKEDELAEWRRTFNPGGMSLTSTGESGSPGERKSSATNRTATSVRAAPPFPLTDISTS